ncbi:beta-glucosidase [Saccharopolyspora erythraea NRRL 2338]|uniref:Beta-glucosidase protein n=2 Tax=Saccharopolyspora erythraea TaxID=1836 RepID=A4F982_SACEN|nr:glycoside hydrolase family 3 C-terminal domain-containing protein [Saccharopolyspora erythraea]EQD86592.1 glycosyl hydrolase family 3 [Saccharopolyspora erythraea D]PFG94400.1 beta-glucosidase [Saccharopolyspora erythraea NRRL 2338]QRK91163.1 glycoside hydrolase family 3 C-terminal domain-containing protein [Saccharopolyspora erythraea]CAM00607.1 beta-glucosidase protein [Saccharopolyspora erythraea NRRL 2338]
MSGAVDRPEPDESRLRSLLAGLTVEQKARLLTGSGFWTLHAMPEIGLHRMVLSDGPNGVRGTKWDERDTSLLLPVASAVAATWDVDAARLVGELFGDEARRRGVHVVLAPTVNLHRSPFGGRHFENFSEDPLLVGEIGAQVVKGIQSRGVAATPKHFVANDSETGRMTYDAVVEPRVLRQVYLEPFRRIVEQARPWAVMTAYNSVNGHSMTENSELVNGILKGEWGWDGVNVSDWLAARDCERCALGGLDLVMPGPGGPWSGGALARAVQEGRVAEELLDDKVLRLLRLAARTGALDGESEVDLSGPPDEARPVIRTLAARGFVLLRNANVDDQPVLPLSASVGKVAVIGENAVLPAVQGGGSSHVSPPHVVTPLDGIRAALSDAEVVFRRGVRHRRLLDPIPRERVHDPEGEGDGLRLDFVGDDGAVLGSELRGTETLLWLGKSDIPRGTAVLRLRGDLRAEPGEHVFGVHGSGKFEVEIAGRVVFDGEVARQVDTDDPLADMIEPPEQRVDVVLVDSDLSEDGTVAVAVDFAPDGDTVIALGLGHGGLVPDAAAEFDAAVRAAREADIAIVVVGTDAEIETEGRDRHSLDLPGAQDALVEAVAAANPRTVVVVNAGSPVLMPWVRDVPAVLWTWFGSQEYGDALADVLLGVAEPGGRLPTTLPTTTADVPVPLPRVQPMDGKLHYSEGTLIGYRAYLARDSRPAFHFGHGLGYTSWEYVDAAAVPGAVRVTVRNCGERAGREVVQVYAASHGRPPWLAGFRVVDVEAGQEAEVDVAVRIPDGSGEHRLLTGRSSGDIRLTIVVNN